MYGHKPTIDREFILSRISEEDIFFKYLGLVPNTVDYFTNPLRSDSYPDCRFYYDSRGVLKFNDFAYKWNVDCFNVVSRLNNNCSYGKALEIVAKDFNLYEMDINYDVLENLKIVLENSEKVGKQIQIKRMNFTNLQLKWWKERNWTPETLKKFNVFSVQMAWLDGRKIYNYNSNDWCFAYYFGPSQFKLYFPLRTNNYRFLQNVGNILQGYDQLPDGGDYLILTKSLKDVGAMDGYNITAAAPMNEGMLLEEPLFEELNNRFFKIFTLFDRDRAGIIASLKYKRKFGTTPLLFDSKNRLFRNKEEPKDFTDHHVAKGTNYLLDLIDYVKYEYGISSN